MEHTRRPPQTHFLTQQFYTQVQITADSLDSGSLFLRTLPARARVCGCGRRVFTALSPVSVVSTIGRFSFARLGVFLVAQLRAPPTGACPHRGSQVKPAFLFSHTRVQKCDSSALRLSAVAAEAPFAPPPSTGAAFTGCLPVLPRGGGLSALQSVLPPLLPPLLPPCSAAFQKTAE